MESKPTFLASYPLWISAWAVAYLHSRLTRAYPTKISFQHHAFLFFIVVEVRMTQFNNYEETDYLHDGSISHCGLLEK